MVHGVGFVCKRIFGLFVESTRGWVIGPSCYPRTTGHSLKAALNVRICYRQSSRWASAPASTGRPSTEALVLLHVDKPRDQTTKETACGLPPGPEVDARAKASYNRGTGSGYPHVRVCAGGAKKNGVPTARGDKKQYHSDSRAPLRFCGVCAYYGRIHSCEPKTMHIDDAKEKKSPVNLRIRTSLKEKAKSLGVNLFADF